MVLHDEYSLHRSSAAVRLTARLVLLCLMSASFIAIFCDIYKFQGNVLIPAVIAAVTSGIIFTLASVFSPTAVYGAFIVLTAVILFIVRHRIEFLVPFFWNYMMKTLDSRFIPTSGYYMDYPVRALVRTSENNQMITAFMWAAVILAVLSSIFFAAAVRTRFHFTIPAVAVILIAAPSFAAEIVGYQHSFIMYLICIFGLEAINSSYDLDGSFIYGSLAAYRLADLRSAHEHRKRIRGQILSERVKSDALRYHRYSGNMITTACVTAVVFFTVVVIIPDGQGINFYQFMDTVSSIGNSALDMLGETFGIPLGTPDDRGYFSSGNIGEFTQSISIYPPGSSDRQVLEVTLSRNDIPVYLRGDIGVTYSGNSWSSVSTVHDDYVASVSEAFYPEMEYQVFRRALAAAELPADDAIPLQMVSEKYLRNTRVVFQPLAAYELNYKNNGQYNYYGDFILRTGNAYINNFEGLALTPALTAEDKYIGDVPCVAALTSAENDVWDLLEDKTIYVPDMINEVYLKELSAYRQFIIRNYMQTDPAVDDFVNSLEWEKAYLHLYSGRYEPREADNESLRRYYNARLICDYFRDNFTYSLESGSEEDMLTGFLYDTHKGHCALFASAMTLALRKMSIPARYVTGFVVYPGGEPDEAGNYHHVLTEKELHAWTEVYFNGVGWIPFDPTAEVPGYSELVYNIPTPTESEVADSVTSEPEQSAPAVTTSSYETTAPVPEQFSGMVPGGETEYVDSEKSAGNIFVEMLPLITILVFIAASAVIVILFFRNLAASEKRVFMRFRKLPPYEACALMYRFVLVLLNKWLGISPGIEQFYDFAERVDKDKNAGLKWYGVFIMDVMPIFEKCEFGTPEISPVTEDERKAVYNYTSELYSKFLRNSSALKRFFMKISLFL